MPVNETPAPHLPPSVIAFGSEFPVMVICPGEDGIRSQKAIALTLVMCKDWQPVTIDAGQGTSGFRIESNTLEWEQGDAGFAGWLGNALSSPSADSSVLKHATN